jgi:hypothetical protein
MSSSDAHEIIFEGLNCLSPAITRADFAAVDGHKDEEIFMPTFAAEVQRLVGAMY